ncbi:uncharacterized protein LOC134287320 [Aedes albopictus]|uniref:Leucine-rich repeat protein n=1 Tax=Aedes albopictus TaxID=7160 RepID=A0ABM1Y3K4_AEDAL
MKEIVVLLLIIAILGGIKSFSVETNEYHQNEAVIRDFHWPADAASVGNIPDMESLYFINMKVDILTQNFTDQFQKCITTKFDGGEIKTIHISTKLTHIELYSTYTENVIIKPRKYYQLEYFQCRGLSLTRIPENMSQLKKMKYLDLSFNLIQTVQLDQLNGLDDLFEIDLSYNKINHINNHGSVSFPSLTYLHLGGNQLKHIDVCSWNVPKLSYLNIVNNRLTLFAINSLRGLKQVNLARNPLNCVWKNSLLGDRTDIKIQEELTCDTNTKAAFGLDCPSTIDQLRFQNSTLIEDSSQTADQLKQQNSNFDSRLAQIEETVTNNSQQIADINNKIQKMAAQLKNLAKKSKINERFQKIETLLENLGSKIVEQQNVSNDIIEAIYRAEMERTYNTNKST